MIMKTTSVALGNYFENFIKESIERGRYNNASEVVRAGLRLLEENEMKILALRSAIDEGLESGVADDFNSEEYLRQLKRQKVGKNKKK